MKEKVVTAAAGIIFVVSVFWAVSLQDILSYFRGSAVMPAMRLALAGGLFIAVGRAVTTFFCNQRVSLVWLLFCGQIASLVWVYAKSGLSRFFDSISSASVAIYAFDVGSVLMVVYALMTRTGWRDFTRSSAYKLLSEVVPLFVLFWISAQRELPRLSVLSSDPDLHIFWAAQVSRLGVIPESLESWGPMSLGYPAGFAALNYLWSAFSGLDLIQIVSVQPLIQSQFAVLLLAVSCVGMVRIGNNRLALDSLLCLLSLAYFYYALPYGYQPNFFHLEGTARTSCLFLLAGMSLGLAGIFCARRDYAGPLAILTAYTCSILIAINPVNALYAGPCLLIVLIATLWLYLTRIYRRGLLSLFAPCMLLGDPYFLGVNQPVGPPTPQDSSLLTSLIGGIDAFLQDPTGHLSVAFLNYFSLDFYSPATTHCAIGVVVGCYLLVRLPFPHRRAVEVLSVLFPCLVIVALSVVIIPGLQPLTTSAALRLLHPYSIHLSQQLMYLYVFYLLVFVSCLVFRRLGPAALIISFVPIAALLADLRISSAALRYEPRYAIRSGLGFPLPEDLAVISKIESFSADVMKGIPRLAAGEAPKILIPNQASDLGWEQWLFPFGASRVLPLRNVLPLAFYYNQGWQEFSYANYQEHVCREFDLQWLKDRNIQYIFVPAQRGPICVKGLRELIKKENVIFKRGKSVFARLF